MSTNRFNLQFTAALCLSILIHFSVINNVIFSLKINKTTPQPFFFFLGSLIKNTSALTADGAGNGYANKQTPHFAILENKKNQFVTSTLLNKPSDKSAGQGSVKKAPKSIFELPLLSDEDNPLNNQNIELDLSPQPYIPLRIKKE